MISMRVARTVARPVARSRILTVLTQTPSRTDDQRLGVGEYERRGQGGDDLYSSGGADQSPSDQGRENHRQECGHKADQLAIFDLVSSN